MKIKTLMIRMIETAMITMCRISEADDRRRRRSRFGGTLHRSVRNTVKPACVSSRGCSRAMEH